MIYIYSNKSDLFSFNLAKGGLISFVNFPGQKLYVFTFQQEPNSLHL